MIDANERNHCWHCKGFRVRRLAFEDTSPCATFTTGTGSVKQIQNLLVGNTIGEQQNHPRLAY